MHKCGNSAGIVHLLNHCLYPSITTVRLYADIFAVMTVELTNFHMVQIEVNLTIGCKIRSRPTRHERNFF